MSWSTKNIVSTFDTENKTATYQGEAVSLYTVFICLHEKVMIIATKTICRN